MFQNIRIRKKANILDITDAVMILLTLVIVFFAVYTVMGKFNTQFDTNSLTNTSTEAMTFYDSYTTKFNSAWDYGVLFAAILFPIFSFIAAKKIQATPSVMIITFIVLGFIIVGSMIVTNIYGAFQGNTEFQTFIAAMTFIPIIIPKLVYYSLFYSVIVLLALFGKPEGT